MHVDLALLIELLSKGGPAVAVLCIVYMFWSGKVVWGWTADEWRQIAIRQRQLRLEAERAERPIIIVEVAGEEVADYSEDDGWKLSRRGD